MFLVLEGDGFSYCIVHNIYIFCYYDVTSFGLWNCLIKIQHSKAVCYREIPHLHCQVKTVGDACAVGFIS